MIICKYTSMEGKAPISEKELVKAPRIKNPNSFVRKYGHLNVTKFSLVPEETVNKVTPFVFTSKDISKKEK